MTNKIYTEKDIPELEAKLEEIDNKIGEVFNSLMNDNVKYDVINESLKPFRTLYGQLSRIHRTLIPKTNNLVPIANDDTHMTLDEFINNVKCGGFIDYDGYGVYATETEKSWIDICPSDITNNVYRKDFSHVVWYNR